MNSIASKNNKLGTEPIPSLLFRMALPSVLAQLVNLLYNMVDRAFVGHIDTVGPMALAAWAARQELPLLWERGIMKRRSGFWETAPAC